MRSLYSSKIEELEPTEIAAVCGGMRLDDFDPSIHVEDQGNVWAASNISGPLSGGYVMYHR